VTHIVYVDPEKYNELSRVKDLTDVGRAVGKLNTLLPKRQFILMGPGRWGSRGDIKLGVQVTYSDFNNTSVLIEIARKKGNYLPELSFGTHFFQDLVESSIRYLPLYPDDPGIAFNQTYLTASPSVLTDMLPEFSHLQETIRVIDVPRVTEGKVLRILMNADVGEAIGFFTSPLPATDLVRGKKTHIESPGEDFWRWRLRMAEQIASQLDPIRFGVKALYVFGSTKNATAGPGSDIDLLIHFQGTPEQRHELLDWLEGWSLCLSEINRSRTGFPSKGLLDVHLVTDEDIAQKTSYAVKIGAVTDAARALSLLN
jgi:pyruvate,water dikinase